MRPPTTTHLPNFCVTAQIWWWIPQEGVQLFKEYGEVMTGGHPRGVGFGQGVQALVLQPSFEAAR